MSETLSDRDMGKKPAREHLVFQMRTLRELFKSIDHALKQIQESDALLAMSLLYLSGAMGALVGLARHVKDEAEQVVKKSSK